VAHSHIEVLPAFPDVEVLLAGGTARFDTALRGDAGLEAERASSRSRAFLRLFPHLVEAERFEGGFRWVFLAVPGLERDLRTLARREHARSPFLTFVVGVQGNQLVWKACGGNATEHALDTLYGMIAEPELGRPPAPSIAARAS
jgi:hypothetical protein